jgi:aminoglycoside 2'-N-acetyltransferase I
VAADGITLRRLETERLTGYQVEAIRSMLTAAFAGDGEGFSAEDWAHAVGGMHFLLTRGDALLAHAAVVARELHLGKRPVRSGYVEAVATDGAHQGSGLGSRVMADADAFIAERFELGALSTGTPRFYERLGWLRWQGETWVRTPAGPVRTPDDDGGILVLPVAGFAAPDLTLPITCEWRPGDVW